MRYLILFCAVLFVSIPSHAGKSLQPGATEAGVAAIAKYCLPALTDRRDPADYVLQESFVELPPEQAQKFSPQGGRVFEIPGAMSNAVFMTNASIGSMCAVALHEIDTAKFWAAVEKNLSGFSLMREKRVEEEKLTKREYSKVTLGGPLTLLITASDVPRPNGLQALITLAHIQE